MLIDHKSGSGSKPKKVSERFSRAIRATTPFRTTRLNPQQHRHDAAVVSLTAPNLSLLMPPPQGDFCLRISKKSAEAPSNHGKGHQSVSVPIIFDVEHSSNDGPIPPYGQGISGAMSLNGVFSEYIDSAGKKIRSPTIVSDPKDSMRHDSFDAKVSEFIDQTKHRFHMPSLVGVSKIVSEQELENQLSHLK